MFAHPDDETSVGRVLARYAAEGHDVYLVTTTSGQAGVANTDIPAGPRLGAAREKEARCSAQKLGIHEPILLQFQDGKVYESANMQGIRDRLRDIVEELKPDVMITWGPDGATGHRDHRLVGDIATQVFLSSETTNGIAWPVRFPSCRRTNAFARSKPLRDILRPDRAGSTKPGSPSPGYKFWNYLKTPLRETSRPNWGFQGPLANRWTSGCRSFS